MVASSESGLQFTKVRHGHPVERSTGSYTKVKVTTCAIQLEINQSLVKKELTTKLIWGFSLFGKKCATENTLISSLLKTHV